jgi:KAP family P-loop domain
MSQDGAAPGSADGVKILIDSPSAKPSLGFGATASALAQIIRDSPARFAVGIFGDWGSGKTTLMEEIQRKLGKTVVSVEFNAWRYEREPQLLIPLLDTIRGALVEWAAGKDADTRERVRTAARKVGRIIRGLAAGLSGEVGLPGAVKVTYDVGKSIDALTVSGEPEQPQSLYVAAFRELSQAFADLSAQGTTRIVVFVDDLDRCLPDNALDVIESMKLFFDLPGFVFVVGLDEDVVQRAVRTRFPESAGLAPGKSAASTSMALTPETQLARDYVEKIFQVPYRLPPVVAEQLNDLLEAMYGEAKLSNRQLEDFRQRVASHLQYVAVRGLINPREVKRFLNTYTLQMLVRPQLNRDIVLSLQTLVFRYDWRVLYDAILTDSMLFSDALARYRSGDDRAFEDLSPDLGAVQDELATYLRSDAVAELASADSLDPYVTSLESTGRTPRWLTAAYREIGRLRLEIRRIRAIGSPGHSDREALSRIASDVVSTLESQLSPSLPGFPAALPGLLQEIRAIMEPIQAAAPDESGTAIPAENLQQLIADSSARLDDVATRIYRALRVARSTLVPPTLA